jgi:hypothetical protein
VSDALADAADGVHAVQSAAPEHEKIRFGSVDELLHGGSPATHQPECSRRDRRRSGFPRRDEANLGVEASHATDRAASAPGDPS